MAFALILLLMLHPDLPNSVAKIALPFHEACLHIAPNSHIAHIYSAIVCGANLPHGEFHEALRITGLIHLIVVSGSHLLFLESLLHFVFRPLKWANILIFLTLIGFALVTQAQPPAVRALASLLLRHLNTRYRLGWSEAQLITVSGFVSFPFCQDEQAYLSLVLSWGAALALHASSTAMVSCHGHELKNSLARHALVYVFLFPLLLPLSPPHAVSILLNWVFSPLLGVLLFPASLISFLIPSLTPLSDQLWGWTMHILIFASEFVPVAPPRWKYANVAALFYLGFITAYLLVPKPRRFAAFNSIFSAGPSLVDR